MIGNGNVAMDVTRILASSYEELAKTDIADYALEALKHSQVRDIYMFGRRGPVQAAFTNPELKEFGEMAEADCVVRPEDIELDPLSQEYVLSGDDRTAERNMQTLQRYSIDGLKGKPRRIHMRFLVSPTQIIGHESVEAIELVHNELYKSDDGSLRPRPTDKKEILPMGLVFPSIGYKGVAIPGVPFDQRRGVIPNAEGRVLDPAQNATVTGEYVVGWIKRGPSGIIGTNKPDSQATVDQMLADLKDGKTLTPTNTAPDSIDALLQARGIEWVSFADWLKLDQLEQQRGLPNRPRDKFTTVAEMMTAIDQMKGVTHPAGD